MIRVSFMRAWHLVACFPLAVALSCEVNDREADRTIDPGLQPETTQRQPYPPYRSPDTEWDESEADESDEGITARIRHTLAMNDLLSQSARNVAVTSEDGVVTVRGQVETEDERHIVLDIAWETEGVREVIDEIVVLRPGDDRLQHEP